MIQEFRRVLHIRIDSPRTRRAQENILRPDLLEKRINRSLDSRIQPNLRGRENVWIPAELKIRIQGILDNIIMPNNKNPRIFVH